MSRVSKYNSEIGSVILGAIFGFPIGLLLNTSDRTNTERVFALILNLFFALLILYNAVKSYKSGVITLNKTVKRDAAPRLFKTIQVICWITTSLLWSMLIGCVIKSSLG